MTAIPTVNKWDTYCKILRKQHCFTQKLNNVNAEITDN